MDNLFSTITSSITRLNTTGTYFSGRELLGQVAKVQFKNGRLGEKKLVITLHSGDVYTVSQYDRDYFEADGRHLSRCQVKGWNDGIRLINSI